MQRVIGSIILIMLGLALLFYPRVQKEIFDSRQRKLIDTFEQLGDMNDATKQVVKKPHTNDENVSLSGARGILEIPKIKLKMMIFEGSEANALSKGIGMIEPDKKFEVDNIGLAGHRGATYGKQFNRLDELAPNDKIEIKTKKYAYTYIVDRSFVVNRTDVSVLSSKKAPYITLVTCTPIGKKNPTERLIVQAKLAKKDKY